MANGTIMPAVRNGDDDDRREKSLLEQAILPALLGLGAGASIRQGNITPLVGAGTGVLAGISQRHQREAAAAAKAEQDRLDRELQERRLAPTINIGPQGPTVSGIRVDAGASPGGAQLPSELQPDILGIPGGAGLPDSGLGVASAALDSPLATAMVSPEILSLTEQLRKRFPAAPKTRVVTDAQGGVWIVEETPGQPAKAQKIEGPAGKGPEPPDRVSLRGTLFERQPNGTWQVAPGAPAPKSTGNGSEDDRDLGTAGERQDFALSQLYELAETVKDESALRRNLISRLKNLGFDDAPARALAANAIQRWRSERRTETRFQERDNADLGGGTGLSETDALERLQQQRRGGSPQ